MDGGVGDRGRPSLIDDDKAGAGSDLPAALLLRLAKAAESMRKREPVSSRLKVMIFFSVCFIVSVCLVKKPAYASGKIQRQR